MHKLIRNLVLPTFALSGSLVGAAPAPSMNACPEATEILAITPLASFTATRRADNAPFYEVKYRHCGQVQRLLIEVPTAAFGSELPEFKPYFF